MQSVAISCRLWPADIFADDSGTRRYSAKLYPVVFRWSGEIQTELIRYFKLNLYLIKSKESLQGKVESTLYIIHAELKIIL